MILVNVQSVGTRWERALSASVIVQATAKLVGWLRRIGVFAVLDLHPARSLALLAAAHDFTQRFRAAHGLHAAAQTDIVQHLEGDIEARVEEGDSQCGCACAAEDGQRGRKLPRHAVLRGNPVMASHNEVTSTQHGVRNGQAHVQEQVAQPGEALPVLASACPGVHNPHVPSLCYARHDAMPCASAFCTACTCLAQ